MAVAKSHLRPTLPNAISTLDLNKYIWNNAKLPKIKLFAEDQAIWKILHEAIPTGDNLQIRGVIQNTSCAFCGGIKSIDHLFLYCTFASQVWDLPPLLTPFFSMSCSSLLEALKESAKWICLPPTGITGDIFSWIIWIIWNARNQLLFKSRHTSPLMVSQRW